jgi:hypothetical protein
MSFKFGNMAQSHASLSGPRNRLSGRKKRGVELSFRSSPLPRYNMQTLFLAHRDARPALDSPAPRDQVNNGDNQRDHEQKMDQTAGHMESPAQKPKDDEDCKNRPKHRYPFKIGNSVGPKGEKRHLRAELSLRICFPEGRCQNGRCRNQSSYTQDWQRTTLRLYARGMDVTSARPEQAWARIPRVESHILSTCDTRLFCRCQARAPS